ncbi:MAG: hypothetical protein VX254_05195, partial [Planctomycetota bacterium]|nr:hypothetical protein [Planctomycetota bacterium]
MKLPIRPPIEYLLAPIQYYGPTVIWATLKTDEQITRKAVFLRLFSRLKLKPENVALLTGRPTSSAEISCKSMILRYLLFSAFCFLPKISVLAGDEKPAEISTASREGAFKLHTV